MSQEQYSVIQKGAIFFRFIRRWRLFSTNRPYKVADTDPTNPGIVVIFWVFWPDPDSESEKIVLMLMF